MMIQNDGTQRGTADESVEESLPSIHYRPLAADDWHRLQLFHRRLSPNTVELRFHGAKRELSTPLAHRLTNLDEKNNFALAATTGTRGRIIGVARYSRISPTSAEVAFVIEDAYQHHGVGRELMRRLREVAMRHGITEFVASVLPGNLPAMRLLHDLGATQSRWEDGEVDVRVDLMGPPQGQAV